MGAPAVTHTLFITSESGSCSCKRMVAVFRGTAEPIGVFTLRAADAHRAHVAARRDAEATQINMFNQQEDMFA